MMIVFLTSNDIPPGGPVIAITMPRASFRSVLLRCAVSVASSSHVSRVWADHRLFPGRSPAKASASKATRRERQVRASKADTTLRTRIPRGRFCGMRRNMPLSENASFCVGPIAPFDLVRTGLYRHWTHRRRATPWRVFHVRVHLMHLLPDGAWSVAFCTKLKSDALSTLRSAVGDKTAEPEGVEANKTEAQVIANR